MTHVSSDSEPLPQSSDTSKVAGSAIKHDSDKPRMDLLDSDFLLGVSDVLTFGAKKYASHNWRSGIAYSRLISAAMRHLAAINRGENIDSESGLHHVDHLACCVMFLSNFMHTGRTELDDRYKAPVNTYLRNPVNPTGTICTNMERCSYPDCNCNIKRTYGFP